MESNRCEHDYVFLESTFSTLDGPGLNYYEQTDRFFCRKCLEYADKIARSENDKYKPSWYKG